MVVAARDALVDVELLPQKDPRVPRCRESHAGKRPSTQREHIRPGVGVAASVIGVFVRYQLAVLQVERQVDEGELPGYALDRCRVAGEELPTVLRRSVDNVGRRQRRKRGDHSLLVRGGHHQVDVVVPRNAAVVAVGADQCAPVHEVRQVGLVGHLGELA